MGFIKKIIKLPFKPYWLIKQHYANRYNPEQYWQKRHKMFAIDSLKGVGHIAKSEKENIQEYTEAADTFLSLCRAQDIDFTNSKVLEVGCGNGFYTKIIYEMGCKNYTGIDIAEYPLEKLRKRYPDYGFLKMDISRDYLNEKFDVIVMIDVTQHIVDEELFTSAMLNVKRMLNKEAIFIVTEWLSTERKQRRFYETERPLSIYQKKFQGYIFSEPTKFRDKYIFSIHKPKKA